MYSCPTVCSLCSPCHTSANIVLMERKHRQFNEICSVNQDTFFFGQVQIMTQVHSQLYDRAFFIPELCGVNVGMNLQQDSFSNNSCCRIFHSIECVYVFTHIFSAWEQASPSTLCISVSVLKMYWVHKVSIFCCFSKFQPRAVMFSSLFFSLLMSRDPKTQTFSLHWALEGL